MLEPRLCLACSAPINPLPPVNAINFNDPYPPDFWEVHCPNCGAPTTILRTDLPQELIRELEESRDGWEFKADELTPLAIDDLLGSVDEATPPSDDVESPQVDSNLADQDLVDPSLIDELFGDETEEAVDVGDRAEPLDLQAANFQEVSDDEEALDAVEAWNVDSSDDVDSSEDEAGFQATWTDSPESLEDELLAPNDGVFAPTDETFAPDAADLAPEIAVDAVETEEVAAVGWDQGTNDALLKRKEEPSLIRKVLPPLLGAAAAFPIALAILWYGFGRDLGGIGQMVAQYVPAVVPEDLHHGPTLPRPTLPNSPIPSPSPSATSEDADDSSESTDITELGQSDPPAQLPPVVVEDPQADIEVAEVNNSLPAAPPTPTQFAADVQLRVKELIDAQETFLTVGATDRSQRIPLANQFWEAVQGLGKVTNEVFSTELASEPSGNNTIFQLLSRDIGPWANSVLSDAKVATLVNRCAAGFTGLTDIGPPTILIEDIPYPDEIDSDYILESEVQYGGTGIEIHIPGHLLQSLGKPESGSANTILFGSIEEIDGKSLFMVRFAIR